MAKSSSKPNSPLGLSPAMRSAGRNPVRKITDNTKGWTVVDNIPVPPAAEKRNFAKPIGAVPVLLNGAMLEAGEGGLKASEQPQLNKEPPSPSGEGVSFSYASPSPAPIGQTVYVEWYGLTMAIDCLNTIYTPAAKARAGQGWLLLEVKIDAKLGKPSWLPPVAELDEHGKITVPEFYCTVNGTRLKCQTLNIELQDVQNEKYIYVLRVIEP